MSISEPKPGYRSWPWVMCSSRTTCWPGCMGTLWLHPAQQRILVADDLEILHLGQAVRATRASFGRCPRSKKAQADRLPLETVKNRQQVTLHQHLVYQGGPEQVIVRADPGAF